MRLFSKTPLGQKENLHIVYHSLEGVLKALTTSEIGKSSEVNELLKIGEKYGILTTSFTPNKSVMSVIKSDKRPFIVMEGLDGSGKTKVSTAISKNLDNIELLHTPPTDIKFLKGFFDEKPEPLRRAFYSFGNYLAAKQVSNTNKAVIMDRYWPSTICYALAHELTFQKSSTISDSTYLWPPDLMQPSILVFLIVSEQLRKQRHATRNTTNTKEEQLLANNPNFRENLIDSYKKLVGPPFYAIDAEEEIEIVTLKIYKILTETYPVLLNKSKSN